MAGLEVPGRQGLGFLNLGVKFGNRPSERFSDGLLCLMFFR